MRISENGNVKITREEYRRIKAMDRAAIECLLSGMYQKGSDLEEVLREKKKMLLKARQAMEAAMNQKGIGPEKKAAIRERYRELMKDV